MNEFGHTPEKHTTNSVRQGFADRGELFHIPLDFDAFVAKFGPTIAIIFAGSLSGAGVIVVADALL